MHVSLIVLSVFHLLKQYNNNKEVEDNQVVDCFPLTIDNLMLNRARVDKVDRLLFMEKAIMLPIILMGQPFFVANV